MRLLFVGQAPSRETDGMPPFVGQCGKFLASLMGLTQEEMLAQHDFINVLDAWPGKGPGGDRFPMAEAQDAAREKIPLMKDRVVVLLGANVARALRCSHFDYLRQYELRDPDEPRLVVSSTVMIVPHPSGVNRWWNSPKNKQDASICLKFLANK